MTNRNKIGFILLFCTLLSTSSKAQNLLLNGDFEYNRMQFIGCYINPSPTSFSYVMDSTSYFSNGINADILSYHDSSACVTVLSADPQHGDFCLGVGKIAGDKETIAMNISEALIPGHTYQLNYWMLNNRLNYTAWTNDTLLIGISNDSLQFGTRIYSSWTTPNVWTRRVVQFTPTTPNKYITITITENSTILTYYMIDNFTLTDVTATNTEKISSQNIQLYPNPANEILYIQSNQNISDVLLEIYNIQGQQVFQRQKEMLQEEVINIANLPAGLYYIRLSSGDKNKTLKFVKQ